MEIAIISGKGGTGKSSISAAFAMLSGQVVLADCDVDAANLHILFNPSNEDEQVYVGGKVAVIDDNACNQCGLCADYCRFDAIHIENGITVIDGIACDGCQLCARICPNSAITMVERNLSRMFAGSFRYGKMVYGKLAAGEGNSGKLAGMVRAKSRKLANEHLIEHIIIDGPPGIGCPVISSITGTDQVVIVTEPTISGLHDLKRTLELVSSFNMDKWVVINKYDLYMEMTAKIKDYCGNHDIAVAGMLPFDHGVTEAMANCMTVTEWIPDSVISKELTGIWKTITGHLA